MLSANRKIIIAHIHTLLRLFVKCEGCYFWVGLCYNNNSMWEHVIWYLSTAIHCDYILIIATFDLSDFFIHLFGCRWNTYFDVFSERVCWYKYVGYVWWFELVPHNSYWPSGTLMALFSIVSVALNLLIKLCV